MSQLYTGFVASCCLLVLAVFLIRRTSHAKYPFDVDTSGVLQVAWLLGSEPRLAKVEQPDIDVLRVAGMYDIDPDALLFRRANASKAEPKDDSSDEQQLYRAQTQNPASLNFRD